MPVVTVENSEEMPFVLPWERVAPDPVSPEVVRLVRGSSARRIWFAISALVLVVGGAVTVPLIALGAEGSGATIAALLILAMMVASVCFASLAPIFVQPSVVVLRQHELVTASLFGNRRRPLGAMTGLDRIDVARKAYGLVTISRSIVYRLTFEEGRPLNLRVPSDDYDARELMRTISDQWWQVRRGEVLRRLRAGETISIPKAFGRDNGVSGPHFHGSVSLSPAGLSIRPTRKDLTEINWDRMGEVVVSEDNRLTILGRGGEVLANVDGILSINMLAINIADYVGTGSPRLEWNEPHPA